MFAETPESTLSLHEVLGYGKYGSALTDPDEHVDHEHDIGGEGRITEPPAQQQQPMQRLRKYAAVATITDPTRKCTCPASDMLAEGWRCACGAAENGA
jgi:hypothetical protein